MTVDAEAEVQELVGRLLSAWNSGNRSEVAAMFTADSDYVTADGEWVHGQEEIRQRLGEQPSNVRVSMQDLPSVRGTAEIASAVSRWTVSDGTTIQNVMTTFILVRKGEQWLIDRLQNTAEKTGD